MAVIAVFTPARVRILARLSHHEEAHCTTGDEIVACPMVIKENNNKTIRLLEAMSTATKIA